MEVEEDPVEKRRVDRKLSLYLFIFIVVSGILFILNVGMVYSFYSGVAVYIPETYSVQVGQLVLLLGPFSLLFLEWYLYDLLIEPFRRRSSRNIAK
jgi:hypothetical protein